MRLVYGRNVVGLKFLYLYDHDLIVILLLRIDWELSTVVPLTSPISPELYSLLRILMSARTTCYWASYWPHELLVCVSSL